MRESQSRVVLIPTQEAYSFLNRKVLEECHWKAICCRKRLKEPVDQRSFAQVEKLQVCNPQQQGKRLSENPQKHSRKNKSALNNCEVQRSPPSYSREVVVKKKKKKIPAFFSFLFLLLQSWKGQGQWGRGKEDLDRGKRQGVHYISSSSNGRFPLCSGPGLGAVK